MKGILLNIGLMVLVSGLAGAEEKKEEITLSEVEMKAFYEQHQENFTAPEQRKISHIIVKEQSQVEALLKKLRAGADFAQLAKENNIDPSKQRGGDLGWVSRKVMVKEFEEAAFQLPKGQRSQVIKTQFGYHIIKVEDIKGAEEKKYEEVTADIKKRIEGERMKIGRGIAKEV